MTLHIITGASAAARLDSIAPVSDDILLLENTRIWNQHDSTNLDPVQHTTALNRPVLYGRPSQGRSFPAPTKLSEVDAIRGGQPVCIWSARNLDDVLLSLWILNHLDSIQYDTNSISFVRAFGNLQSDPISSVEQLSDRDVAAAAGQQ